MKFHSAVQENRCLTFIHHLLGRPLIAKIPIFSIVSFIGVYGSKFTKLSTLVEHHGDCLPWKFDGGLQQKILRELPKTWNFGTCTCKSAHCVYLGESKVKVEHTHCRPLSYGSTAVRAFRNSLPFRSYKLRTVCTDCDFSVFSPQKIIWGPSQPPFGYDDANSISPLSFGKSFMKIRSAIPENGCLIFTHYRCGGRKKNKRNICKTYTHSRPIAARMRKHRTLPSVMNCKVRRLVTF